MKLKLFLGVVALSLLCGCGNESNPAESSASESQTSSTEFSSEATLSATDASTEVSTQAQTQMQTPAKEFYPLNSEGLEVYDAGAYKVVDPDNKRGLQSALLGYGFGLAGNGLVPQASISNQNRFDSLKTGALCVDLKSKEKVLYLTFDCGYEYQDNSLRILDTLKEKQAPAAFFCTYPFVSGYGDRVKRMIDEGHIVGNHSVNHLDFPTLTRIKMAEELYGVYNFLKTKYNYETKYFRFPAGRNSDNCLDLVASQGYRAIFWSFAYADWDTANQMPYDQALNYVKTYTHPGAVILLHEVSPTNVAILGEYIDWARSQGYTFKSLDYYYTQE